MKKSFFCTLAVIVLFFGVYSSASAAIQNFSGGGAIIWAELGNPYGLSTDDSVSWSTSYDPAWIEELHLGPGVSIGAYDGLGGSLAHQIGAHTLVASDDVDFPDFPWVLTRNGLPSDFNFVVTLLSGQGGYSVYERYFMFTYNEQTVAEGVFYDLAQAPVPAAVWLLGSGLLGLVGLRRKFGK